jgi:hypothetical protein
MGWLVEPMLNNRILQHRWISMNQETDTLSNRPLKAPKVKRRIQTQEGSLPARNYSQHISWY